MIRLSKLGHVNLRVSDEEQARRFYCDVLGLQIAERDPDNGGVFTTLGENFHTLDFAQHPDPDAAQKPVNEFPCALQLFANGRRDEDQALEVGGVDDPPPAWLGEDWPGAEMEARIDAIRRQVDPVTA